MKNTILPYTTVVAGRYCFNRHMSVILFIGVGIPGPMSFPWIGIPGTRSLLGVGMPKGVGLSGGWVCSGGGYVWKAGMSTHLLLTPSGGSHHMPAMSASGWYAFYRNFFVLYNFFFLILCLEPFKTRD